MFLSIVSALSYLVSASQSGVPVPPPPPEVTQEHTADMTITDHIFIFQPSKLPPPKISSRA